MPRLHHVNLAHPPGRGDAESDFLVSVLGYRSVAVVPTPTSRWFDADDGTQVHLSEDPDHRPAAHAHTALELPDRSVEAKLIERGIGYEVVDRPHAYVVLCEDPVGNRWELRCPPLG